MKYRFAFDRTRLIVLFGGTLVAGALTFVAGVLSGLALLAPSKQEISILKAQHATQQAAATGTTAQPPAQTMTPQPLQAQLPQTPAPVPAVPATGAQPEPVVLAAAKPATGPADVLGADLSPEKDIFSLQIGAYLDPKAARELQTDLRERGYPAAIFNGVDSDRKEWHAVRIGGFDTLTKASAAAASFTSKERLQALIRPSGGL